MRKIRGYGKAAQVEKKSDSIVTDKKENDGKLNISFQRKIQLFSLVLVNGYAAGFAKGKIFTGKTKAVCVPVLNCYSCPGALGACPIGSLQAFIGKGRFPFYVLGTMMLFGVLIGRAVCGLLCPFGLVQDLLYKIPVRRLRVPERIDKPARLIKYVILAVMVVLLPFLASGNDIGVTPYFCKYLCPAGTLGGGIPLVLMNKSVRNAVGALFCWKSAVLLSVVIASVLIQRPFCRYLCPLGAFYSFFNRFSFYQMKLDRDRCIGCKACERSCPMAVKVTRDINSAECIRCGKCKTVCGTDAISSGFRTGSGSMNHTDETNQRPIIGEDL